MANNPPPNPGWRNPGARPTRPAPPRHDWQGKPPVGGARPRPRWVKRVGVSGAIGAVMALLIIFLPKGCTKDPFVIVVAENQAENLALPANAYGARDGEAMRAAAAEWAVKDAVPGPEAGETPTQWLDRLDKKDWNNAKRPLVLYLSLYGGADEQNGKFDPLLWLLPKGATAPDPSSQQVRIRDLLTHLKDPAKHPTDQKKLLILDATQVGSSWPHGQLSNEFARGLLDIDADIRAVPNLVVIASSDVGQRSWAIEGQGQSAFGYYLVEGLRSRPQTAKDLFGYVEGKVRDWARDNRDARQMPQIFPRASSPVDPSDGLERAAAINLPQFPGSPPAASAGSGGAALAPDWKKRDDLEARGRPVAPEVIAPRAWRVYLETLLRAEQLDRAGAATNVIGSALARQAFNLEQDLAGKNKDPRCLATALPLGVAFGRGDLPDLAARVTDLGDVPTDAERGDRWQAIQAGQTDREALRLAAARAVYDLVRKQLAEGAGDVRKPFRRAQIILNTVFAGDPRPVEAHFLLMLNAQVSEAAWANAAKLRPALERGLAVREQAERVALAGGRLVGYPYTEQVARWTQQAVREADGLRRPAEDLLFADEAKDLEESATRFQAAAEAYERANKIAEVVVSALQQRDRALARLPFYARWLAAHRPNAPTMPSAKLDELVGKAFAAFAAAHALTAQLDGSPDAARVDDMGKTTAALSQDFDAVESAFKAEIAELRRQAANSAVPGYWLDIDAALQVPFISAQDRRELLDRLKDVKPPTGGNYTRNELADQAAVRGEARRNGRLALAALGAAWVDDPDSGRRSDGTDRDWARLDDAVAHDDDKAIARAGAQIGRHWRAIDAVVKKSVEGALKEEPVKARTDLARAARLDRLADGSAGLGGVDPGEALRQLARHDLLLEQARRALDDGWADLNGGEYSLEAAKVLREAARRLIVEGVSPGSPAEKARLTEVEKLVPAVPRITLNAPTILSVSGRPEERLDYALARPNGWPAHGKFGFPMFRVDLPPTGPFRLAVAGGRRTVRTFNEVADVAAADTRPVGVLVDQTMLNSGAALPPNPTANAIVLHRGHVEPKVTQIRAGGVPTVRWVWEPPAPGAKAGLAVLGDNLPPPHVVILLDKSYSMGDDLSGGRAGPSKDTLANAMLGEFLSRDLSAGSRVTIYTFHGKVGVVGHVGLELQRYTDEAEVWDPVRTGAVLEKLREQTPEGWTPLTDAVKTLVGEKKGLPMDAPGQRVFIVLTDGAETVLTLGVGQGFKFRDDGDDGAEAGRQVRQALTNYKGNLDFFMIVFGLSGAGGGNAAQSTEAKAAIRQFKIIEENDLRKGEWLGQRQMIFALTTERLRDTLKDAMVPRYSVVDANGVPSSRPERIIRSDTEGLQVGMTEFAPGVYSLRALGQTFEQIALGPDDRLLLQLSPGSNGYRLQVPAYTAVPWKGRPNFPKTEGTGESPVDLTVPANGMEDRSPRGLVQRVVLERPRSQFFRVNRPQFAWFEVVPDGRPRPANERVEIHNLAGRLGSAWELRFWPWAAAADGADVRDAPAQPRVTAYWVDSFARLDAAPLDVGALAGATARNVPLTVGDVKVVVQDLHFEDATESLRLTVNLTGGGRVLARLTDIPDDHGQPVRVREEHRYFDPRDARYEASFTFPRSAGVRDRRVQLRFYALDAVRRGPDTVAVTGLFSKPVDNDVDQVQVIPLAPASK